MTPRDAWLCSVVLAIVVLAGACSGSGGADLLGPGRTDATATATVVSAEPTGEATSGSAGVIETIPGARPGEVAEVTHRVTVNQAVRYAGFDATVGDVLIGSDPAGFTVAQVFVTLRNDTDAPDSFNTAVEIESAGAIAVIDRSESPRLDPGASGSGYFSLRLAPTFDLDDAVLLIGRADRSRAEIPLGSRGELVTRLPLQLAVPPPAADDVSTIEVTSVTLGWDASSPRLQASPGQTFIHMEYVLESMVATSVGDVVVTLRAEDGSTVSPTKASIASVDPNERVELSATFLVEADPPGPLTFVYTERFGNGTVDVPIATGG